MKPWNATPFTIQLLMPCPRNVMKFLVCVLILLTSSVGLTAQEPPPTRATDGLSGPVKSIEWGSINYAIKDGKRIEGEPRPIQAIKFDEHGNRTEAITFENDGTIKTHLTYTYDALGRNTGYNESYRLASNQSLSSPRKHTYTLDHNGRIVEFILYEADGSAGSRFTYKYDDKGNKIEQAYYAWTGARTGRLTYSYDAAGRRLSETSYDSHGAVSWKTVNTYDSNGRVAEWVQYQGEVLRYKKLFKYDHKGGLAEVETLEFNAPPNLHISHAPVPGKIVYTYDDKRRSKEISTYEPNGALKSREVQTFDEQGNQVSRAFFNADGSAQNSEIAFYDKNKLLEKLGGKSLTQFTYDAHGNWTKKVHLILPDGANEPRPWRVDYRNITYYKD